MKPLLITHIEPPPPPQSFTTTTVLMTLLLRIVTFSPTFRAILRPADADDLLAPANDEPRSLRRMLRKWVTIMVFGCQKSVLKGVAYGTAKRKKWSCSETEDT